MIGKKVVIRTERAGVHFGTLVALGKKTGMGDQSVHLTNARRLWSWNGALSLSEVAMKGIQINNSKISVPVEEIILPQAVEIILIGKDSNLPCN